MTATIIPATPVGSLPSEVLKAYRFFKSLPDDYTIWHHLTPWEREAPDFLIVNEKRQAILLKISFSTSKAARTSAQMLLMSDKQASFGALEENIINKFAEALPAKMINRIKRVILFTNVPEKILLTSPAPIQTNIAWMGQEMLTSPSQEKWQKVFLNESLQSLELEQLRMRFTPESIVPATLTVRQADKERQSLGIQDYLLDLQQESILKNDLELPVEQNELTKNFQINIVNGVAGSGKSLILLYRLQILRSLFPHKRFLVLTHNRPLIRDLQFKYKQLSGGLPRQITWETFNGFCRRHWPDQEVPWLKPLGEQTRNSLIEESWKKHFVESNIKPESLKSEIDWFKDQIPMNKSSYLDAERKGRGFRLQREQRLMMWDAMLEYQNLSYQKRTIDWGDVPRRMWDLLRKKKVALPLYDVILVDEAQFFAPIWFDVIRRAIRPKTGHIFIVADPTQGFLGRGTSWKSLGFDVRGRTHRLYKSYRTTQEILNFATLFYRMRSVQGDTDDDILEPDLLNMPHGAIPVLVPVRSPQDEHASIVNNIKKLDQQGYPLKDILVLHADWEGTDTLIEMLNRKLGNGRAMDPKTTLPGDCVRVTTLNAGTGLESPVVFLVGLYKLFEREQSLRLSDNEIEKVMLENTRKIYMAATRAGQRLVITYVGQIPDILRSLLILPRN